MAELEKDPKDDVLQPLVATVTVDPQTPSREEAELAEPGL